MIDEELLLELELVVFCSFEEELLPPLVDEPPLVAMPEQPITKKVTMRPVILPKTFFIVKLSFLTK